MLYVTTRNNLQADTPHRVLQELVPEDGGMYLPLKGPVFSREELRECSSNGCVALVLNRLFGSDLTSYDVDFAIGRHFLRTRKLPGKVLAGECWHNVEGKAAPALDSLRRLLGSPLPEELSWTEIALRAAVLFGLLSEQERSLDLAVPGGDFAWPMAAWYARRWGAPIREIVICCNENNGLWELFHQGQLRTDLNPVPTDTPELDVTVPFGLERLIRELGGVSAVENWLKACRSGQPYVPEKKLLRSLAEGVTVSVVGRRRRENTMFGVKNACGYDLTRYGALVYAGLQDHRSRTGDADWVMMVLDRE